MKRSGAKSSSCDRPVCGVLIDSAELSAIGEKPLELEDIPLPVDKIGLNVEVYSAVRYGN